MKEKMYRATNTLLSTSHINRLHPLETDNGPALATDTRCTDLDYSLLVNLGLHRRSYFRFPATRRKRNKTSYIRIKICI